MSDNLNDLANAAKLKLQAQKKQEVSPAQEDIYAEFRDETEAENYPAIQPVPQVPEEVFEEIPIDEDDYQIYDR